MPSYGLGELWAAMIEAYGAPPPTSFGSAELLEDMVNAITNSGTSGGPYTGMIPANFPNWRLAVANARGNTAASYVLCIGTSITAGNPALTTPATQAVPAVLSSLCSSYLCPSQLSLIALQPSLVSNSDTRFNFPLPANWTAPGTPSVGWADVGYFHASPSAATLTYTPANGSVDSFSTIYAGTSLTGTLNQNIDGGTNAPLNTHNTTVGIYRGAAVTATAGTSHAFNLSTAAANAAFPVAIDAYLSTQAGLRFGNAGIPLLGTTAAWQTSAADASLATIEAIAPSLSIIELGADDAPLKVDPSAYSANLSTIIAACKLSGDVLLWTTPLNTNLNTAFYTSQYNAVQRQLATSLGCGLVDIGNRFGPYATGWGAQGFSADGTHPNALGCTDIAGAILAALTSVA